MSSCSILTIRDAGKELAATGDSALDGQSSATAARRLMMSFGRSRLMDSILAIPIAIGECAAIASERARGGRMTGASIFGL